VANISVLHLTFFIEVGGHVATGNCLTNNNTTT